MSPCRFNAWSPCSFSRRFDHALGHTRRSSMADLVDIADRVSARQGFSARIRPSDTDIKPAAPPKCRGGKTAWYGCRSALSDQDGDRSTKISGARGMPKGYFETLAPIARSNLSMLLSCRRDPRLRRKLASHRARSGEDRDRGSAREPSSSTGRLLRAIAYLQTVTNVHCRLYILRMVGIRLELSPQLLNSKP